AAVVFPPLGIEDEAVPGGALAARDLGPAFGAEVLVSRLGDRPALVALEIALLDILAEAIVHQFLGAFHIRAVLEDRIGLHVYAMLVPAGRHRRAGLGRSNQARTPDRPQHGLLAAQHLGGQRAGIPELRNGGPHARQRVKGAFDIEGIELVQCHAVRQQRKLEVGRSYAHVGQHAWAGEGLGVPELGPALRLLAGGVGFGVVAHDDAIDKIPDYVLVLVVFVDVIGIGVLEFAVWNGQQRAGALEGHELWHSDVHDVELHVARLQHGHQFGAGGGHGHHLDASLLAERLIYRFTADVVVNAAGRADDHAPGRVGAGN